MTLAKLSTGFAFKKPLLHKTPYKYSRYFLRRFACNHLLKRQTEWYSGRLFKVFITVFEHPPTLFGGFCFNHTFPFIRFKKIPLLLAPKLLICLADMSSHISRASKTLYKLSRGIRLEKRCRLLTSGWMSANKALPNKPSRL